jgi:uncharacterized membrane protein
MLGLGDLPGANFGSRPWAASADGSVIVGGSYYTTTTDARAFIWDGEAGLRRLQDLLIDDFDLGDELAGWTLRAGLDVSPDGRFIVGIGWNPSGQAEGWIADLGVSSVPEPGTLSLLGLVGAALARRRWRGCR